MHRTSEWSYDAVWPSDAENVGKAREFVVGHLVDYGVPVVDEVQLVVSELATNAVAHARTDFGVTISRLDGVVEIAVHDGDSLSPSVLSADEHDENGRGMQLVERVSDSWGVDAPSVRGKSVWARFVL
jgi:anti-sigma regulatory factor (Ser/Thr protein kinase)